MPETTTSEPTESFTATINRAAFQKERVRLSRDGKDVAAVIPIEDLELLEELEDHLDVLEALEAIEEARQTGGVIPWEEFEAELDRS
jgi:hypothetical protein